MACSLTHHFVDLHEGLPMVAFLDYYLPIEMMASVQIYIIAEADRTLWAELPQTDRMEAVDKSLQIDMLELERSAWVDSLALIDMLLKVDKTQLSIDMTVRFGTILLIHP